MNRDFLWRCEGPCGRAFMLLFRTKDDRLLDPECWAKAGRPPLRDLKAPADLELETVEHMIKRGGTDRYRALAGKA